MYKRWFRTLPPYFLVLGFITFYALILNSRPGFTLLEIRRYVLFIQNLNWPHPSFFPEAWSLAVEEWFYLLVPFSAFALCRFLPPKKAVLLLTLLVILAVPVIRYLKSGTVDSLETWDMLLRKQVVTRLDSIVFGLLGAWLHYYYNAFWLRFRQPAFIIGLLILIFTGFTEGRWPGFYFNVLSFSLAALGVLLTLPFMHNIKQGAGAVYHFLTHISHVSYSMYLLHYTLVLHLLVPGTVALFPLAGWTLDYGLYWLYSFILASFMYAFFEKPVMKLRNKLELKKATV
jgi:peptidoglycan/LPS O-acetylase OafA/YrhL